MPTETRNMAEIQAEIVFDLQETRRRLEHEIPEMWNCYTDRTLCTQIESLSETERKAIDEAIIDFLINARKVDLSRKNGINCGDDTRRYPDIVFTSVKPIGGYYKGHRDEYSGIEHSGVRCVYRYSPKYQASVRKHDVDLSYSCSPDIDAALRPPEESDDKAIIIQIIPIGRSKFSFIIRCNSQAAPSKTDNRLTAWNFNLLVNKGSKILDLLRADNGPRLLPFLARNLIEHESPRDGHYFSDGGVANRGAVEVVDFDRSEHTHYARADRPVQPYRVPLQTTVNFVNYLIRNGLGSPERKNIFNKDWYYEFFSGGIQTGVEDRWPDLVCDRKNL